MTQLQRLHRRGLFRIKPGLERIRALLRVIGDPQFAQPTLHIAGTNGKGSVAACLESVLRTAGYRTGLYSSPHLADVRERIQIDRRPISSSHFKTIAQRLFDAERKTGRQLTYFEFLTALAFQAFCDHSVDVAIVETGMGGRWDATNVLIRPSLSIITSIGLDHTQWLGRTEAAIAREKAGILKSGSPVISGVRGRAASVIAARARELNIPLLQIDRDFRAATGVSQWERSRQSITYSGPMGSRTVTLGLLGSYQADNAAVALASLETLQNKGWAIGETALQKGLTEVAWPGRFQFQGPTEPRVLFDGAHNPPALERLLEALAASPWKQTPKTFVFSAYRDKDYRRMLKLLVPHAARLIICTLPGSRSLSARQIARAISRRSCPVHIVADPHNALRKARQLTPKQELIVVTGSLALIGLLLKNTPTLRAEAVCPR